MNMERQQDSQNDKIARDIFYALTTLTSIDAVVLFDNGLGITKAVPVPLEQIKKLLTLYSIDENEIDIRPLINVIQKLNLELRELEFYQRFNIEIFKYELIAYVVLILVSIINHDSLVLDKLVEILFGVPVVQLFWVISSKNKIYNKRNKAISNFISGIKELNEVNNIKK